MYTTFEFFFVMYVVGIIASLLVMRLAKPHHWHEKHVNDKEHKQTGWIEIALMLGSWISVAVQLGTILLTPAPLPPMPTHDEVDANKFPW